MNENTKDMMNEIAATMHRINELESNLRKVLRCIRHSKETNSSLRKYSKEEGNKVEEAQWFGQWLSDYDNELLILAILEGNTAAIDRRLDIYEGESNGQA